MLGLDDSEINKNGESFFFPFLFHFCFNIIFKMDVCKDGTADTLDKE